MLFVGGISIILVNTISTGKSENDVLHLLKFPRPNGAICTCRIMGPSNPVVFDINLHGLSKVVVIHEHGWTKGVTGEVQSSSLSGED